MVEGPVAFLDSGIGGLPYLAHARMLLPRERFVYAADRRNFPYGGKSAEQITAAITALTAAIILRENPKLIVVACNTASVVSLAALRSRFPVPFVGVVPAVKPAAARSAAKSVGVLATQRTAEGDYLKSLIERFASGCRVVSLPASDLVSFVERDLYRSSSEERRRKVNREACRFREAGVDTVVLGCTHFLHLENEFRQELGEGIHVVDSREGVARQVARLLGYGDNEPENGHGGASGGMEGRPAGGISGDPRRPPDSFYVTGAEPLEESYTYFAATFSLRPEGALPG